MRKPVIIWFSRPGQNYWGTYPMALQGYLKGQDLKDRQTRFLVTHEGSGAGKVKADLEKLCPGAQILDGLSVYGHQMEQAAPEIRRWLKAALDQE